jgi:hypothetical protein
MATRLEDQLRKLGFTDEQIAGATVDGKPLSEVKPKPKRSDGWPGFKSSVCDGTGRHATSRRDHRLGV